MTLITWACLRYVQELTTILGPQNCTQGSCVLLLSTYLHSIDTVQRIYGTHPRYRRTQRRPATTRVMATPRAGGSASQARSSTSLGHVSRSSLGEGRRLHFARTGALSLASSPTRSDIFTPIFVNFIYKKKPKSNATHHAQSFKKFYRSLVSSPKRAGDTRSKNKERGSRESHELGIIRL